MLCPFEGYGWIWKSHFRTYIIILPVFCRTDHSAPFEHLVGSQKWRAGGQSYRFYFDGSELLQLVSSVQLNDTAGSGGIILGPTKVFSPVYHRTDRSVPFEHPRFAWIFKMASWRPVLQVLFRPIRATSASELCPFEGYGWIWKSHFRTYIIILPVFCRTDHSAPFEHLVGSQKWRAGGQSYRFYFDGSELLQLVSSVQLNDIAGSGGIILGPTKVFSPVFCRTDHSVPFENLRFAWISKMVSWRPVLKVLF